MLFLLARFRFPETAAPQVQPVAAPLERLAARATFDELAATMADLERRTTPAVVVAPIVGERMERAFVPAVRFTPDRAIALLARDERLDEQPDGVTPVIIAHDAARGLVVLQVAARPGDVVTPRAGGTRPGPRYVAVVEAGPQGPAIRPVYVGRTDLFQDPRTGDSMLAVGAAQQTLSRGSAVFTLDGQFVGLVSESGGAVAIFPAERLQTIVQSAQPAAAARADLGIEVQAMSPDLARATGVGSGVMVAGIDRTGPAAGALRSSDVIQAVDGVSVTTVGGFQQLAQTRAPGTEVALAIVRGGKALTVQVRARLQGSASAAAADDSGLVLQTIAGAGAEVVAIAPRTPAMRAGLQRGDLVVALNGEALPDAAAVERAYQRAAPGAALLLTIQRGSSPRVVALEKR
jgi:hypothetical protein